ncbi:hypothetical protein HOO68_02435 [Candidatus Gracilibacteria bacterium]|nr:hypothetical protein [Candidatus Gracilibacteria bacterium]
MLSAIKGSADAHGYEEFGMSDMLLVATFGRLITENKKGFDLMEKMFHRLDPLLRAGNSGGATVVLDAFLDGYEFERPGNCDVIPAWFKEFIKLASKKIRDLNDHMERQRKNTSGNLTSTRASIIALVDPKV